jgi:hypothetical protein
MASNRLVYSDGRTHSVHLHRDLRVEVLFLRQVGRSICRGGCDHPLIRSYVSLHRPAPLTKPHALPLAEVPLKVQPRWQGHRLCLQAGPHPDHLRPELSPIKIV